MRYFASNLAVLLQILLTLPHFAILRSIGHSAPVVDAFELRIRIHVGLCLLLGTRFKALASV